MRFVILGAGAVGGTIGGLLHDAGYDVLLLARGAHAEALRDRGLRLATPSRVLTARLPVVEAAADLPLGDDDVLVLTTKTQDTIAVLDALPRRDLPVVCAQNGVTNERLALRRLDRVYAMVVMLPAVHLEPGRVEAQGAPKPGLLDVGRYPSGTDAGAEAVSAALRDAGFASRPDPTVMRWKYAKLLRNLGNALEALCGHPGDAADAAVLASLGARARAEAEACFAAAGIDWAGDEEWQAHRGDQVGWAPVEGRSRSGGSTWQSLARGAGRSEVDYLNGEICLLGRLHGVATPVNATLVELTNQLATAGGAPGSVAVGAVAAAVPVVPPA